MPDIAPIKGLIELQDDFTGQLGLAEAALGNFTKANQESLIAVAGAAGLVVAALGAVTIAVIELGKRGADVNDVNATLEHFAGGADQARLAMDALRAGTKDTVDNFTLAKEAAHLLSAGVKLTAQDFGLLGEAAFVLQNRGLGGTKEQLELVSSALVTGRTRALAMSLGVIDNANAMEDYAKSIGVTVDQLSDAGKAEAKRIEVMRLLSVAVKDAGEQTRDFGEHFEFIQAQVINWVDDLGSAIASSKVFEAALSALEGAFTAAFGGDKSETINKVVRFIEQGAIAVVGFAQNMIVMAKVAEVVWNGIRTVVLGVETAVLGLATGFAEVSLGIGYVANAVGLLSDESLQAGADQVNMLEEMTKSLATQTAEAAVSTVTHTAFDESLDRLSMTLGNVKASMMAASDATGKQTATAEVAVKGLEKLAATQEVLNQKMINTAKIREALEKSTKELNGIWSDYNQMIVASSGTTRDSQVADIEATFQKQVDALEKLDPLYKQKYDAYVTIAQKSMRDIDIAWDSVKDSSLESAQEQAAAALELYERMKTGSLTFSREALKNQLDKYKELQNEVRTYGRSVSDAVMEASSSIQILDHSWVTDADIAAATINKTTVMVRTLSGELITLMEAQRRQQQGFSYQVSPIDQFEIDRTPGGADALLKELMFLSQNLETMRMSIRDAKTQNDYFHALARYNVLRDAYNLLVSQARNKPPTGFAEGGTVMVGEKGPEIIRLPIGATVYPTGMMPIPAEGMAGDVVFNNTWHVNGTGADVAREVSSIIMRQLKQARQFGAA